MNGQEFLVFFLIYGIIIFCVLQFAITYYLNDLYPINNFSETNYQDLSNYEIAYLTGGFKRLFEVLIFSLFAKGFLVRTNLNEVNPIYLLKTVQKNDELEIENILIKKYPNNTIIDLEDKKQLMYLKKDYSTFGTQVHNELSEIGLLLFHKEKILLYIFKAIAISFIIGLSFYRISYALAHGHHNIFFLIILTIIFTIFIIKFFKISTISPHGKMLIKHLQKKYNKKEDKNFTELLNNKEFDLITNPDMSQVILLLSIFGSSIIPDNLWEFEFLKLLNPINYNTSSNFNDWSTSSSGCSSACSSNSSDSGCGSGCSSGCGGCGGGGD